MRHLYWHQDEDENKGGADFFSVAHTTLQLQKLSCESEFFDRARVSCPLAPNCAEPEATLVTRFRPQKPNRLSGVQLFFNTGPILLYPSLDFLFIFFYSLPLWLLRAPTHRTQKSPNMINMVMDPEQVVNQSRHARTCPKVSGESGSSGSFQKFSLQNVSGFVIKFLRATRRSCFNGFYTIFKIRGFPSPDASAVNFHYASYLNRLVILIKQTYCSTPAISQFLRASFWSHDNTSDPEYRTLLCRCQ